MDDLTFAKFLRNVKLQGNNECVCLVLTSTREARCLCPPRANKLKLPSFHLRIGTPSVPGVARFRGILQPTIVYICNL